MLLPVSVCFLFSRILPEEEARQREGWMRWRDATSLRYNWDMDVAASDVEV